MKKIFSVHNVCSIVFGIIVFLFFGFLYPFHLHYQEQYQLFLFTGDYFIQSVSQPGGVSNYLGTFFTQFYFYSWIGSFIISLFLVLLQRSLFATSIRVGGQSKFFILSFIPSLMYWGLLCNESYMTGGLVAVLFLSASLYGYTYFQNISGKFLAFLLGLPLLYWFSGGVTLVFLLFALTKEFSEKKLSLLQMTLFLVFGVALMLILPTLVKNNFGQYSLIRTFVGVNYYRYPINFPLIVSIISFLLLLIPFFSRLLSKIGYTNGKNFFIVQLLFVFVFGGWFMHESVDFKKEEIMEYDFYVRMRKWDKIVKKAEEKTPTSPLSVTCLNLALGKKGALGDRMFEFYQNGVDGLIPNFTKDYTIPMIAGEVYYHLGFINTAQRFVFEAMEALPDYQKSVRVVKRLAETSLINGNYVLSKKYLKILQNTFYYRKWALHFEKALNSGTVIDRHAEYGTLKNVKLKKDFLFSEGEKDMMLGILFSENRGNKLAFEYLMAYYLLKKDIQHFVQHFPLGESLIYFSIPKHFQEALTYAWDVSKSNVLKEIPYDINPGIKAALENYKRIYTSKPNPKAELKNNFSDTYWYYFHFRNKN